MRSLPHSPEHTPAPVTAPVLPGLTVRDAERVASALEANLAASTRTVYASAWRQWEKWAAKRGIPALPASPEAIAAFLAERAESGISYGTIDLACSAIAFQHHEEGLPDPMMDLTVRRVRRGLRRIVGAAPRRQAHPLTLDELTQMVTAIDLKTSIGQRDRAMLLLGYAAALRPSELAALHLADVSSRHGGLLITVRRSKTDQDGYGQRVGVAAGTYHQTDPITALSEWLAARPSGPGPLFTRIQRCGNATGTAIDVRTVSRMVADRARSAGLEGLPVSGHSLRAGHATTAADPVPRERRFMSPTETPTRSLTCSTSRWKRPAASSPTRLTSATPRG